MGNQNDEFLASLFPPTAFKVRRLMAMIESDLQIGSRAVSGYRSSGEQAALYEIGRTKAPLGDKYIVTNAKTCDDSFHGHRRAVDLYPEINGKVSGNNDTNMYWWKKMADLAAGVGLVSGKGFQLGSNKLPDLPHYEDHFCATCLIDHSNSRMFTYEGTCVKAIPPTQSGG